MITGETNNGAAQPPVFGLIGRKLGHSFSPAIHARLGTYRYQLFELEPQELEGFVKHGIWKGCNVTIPYKESVFELCDRISEEARVIGSVNTLIKSDDGTVFGDNTDYYGFDHLIRCIGVDISGSKALVLGNGGAAKTVRAVLRSHGAEEIVTVSRKGDVTYDDIADHADASLIVNTTPVGMYPHCPDSPIDLIALSSLEGFAVKAVVDIVYNPLRTGIMAQAEQLGIPCANGLSMLVAQAKRASELFQGCIIDDGSLLDIQRGIEQEMRNIALIGMPGSGKTSVGNSLAHLLGREFIDIDEEIVKLAGCSIPEIFEEQGEAAFRDIETRALETVAKRSGIVISCGGGAVLRPKNLDLLKQNSTIAYLERPLHDLACEGRPLSGALGVDALFATREPLYSSWADFRIENTGTIEDAAKAVASALESEGNRTPHGRISR